MSTPAYAPHSVLGPSFPNPADVDYVALVAEEMALHTLVPVELWDRIRTWQVRERDALIGQVVYGLAAHLPGVGPAIIGLAEHLLETDMDVAHCGLPALTEDDGGPTA